MNRIELEHNVLEWALDKDILNRNPDAIKIQTLKLVAEVGELCDEIIKGNRDNTIMELGDVEIVLTILKEQLKLSQNECLEAAYNKIKNRTGRTIDGTFIKTSDL